MSYTWEYGAAGSGLHFIVEYDAVAGTFSVTSYEGSFDLNAFWFSNGDETVDGDTSLEKDEKSLNMNGSTTVWDDYLALSSTGLGSEGEDKETFISAGETYTFEASVPDGWDPATGTLGIRATSVNGDGSIKFADTQADCDFDEIVFFDNFSNYTSTGAASWGYKADLSEDVAGEESETGGSWSGQTSGSEIVNDGYQGIAWYRCQGRRLLARYATHCWSAGHLE